MINYGLGEKKGENGKIKSGNTNRPIRFDSRSRVANKLLVCIVLLFLLPCAERGVWCMHSPYTVMTFPQYNQREKWTRIPEKKAKEQKGIE